MYKLTQTENILNFLGNIIYYLFNFVTAPILTCYGLGKLLWVAQIDFFITDGGLNELFVVLIVLIFGSLWRVQYLLVELFVKDSGFGLDFYKYKKRLNNLENRTPSINENIYPRGLYELYKKYCLDETLDIKHNKIKGIGHKFDWDKITQVDTNCISGYNSSFKGRVWSKQCFHGSEHGVSYPIFLKENPPLSLFTINSRFYAELPKYWVKSDYRNTFYKKVEDLQDTYEVTAFDEYKDMPNGLIDYEVNLLEFAISMGNIIEFISKKQYDELVKLHKNAESNYSEYMLKKRLEEK